MSNKTFRFVGTTENFVATKTGNNLIEKTVTLNEGDTLKGRWINDEGSFADLSLDNGWQLECVCKVFFTEVA